MINGEKVMAIIPARKGSKGLPGKNKKKLRGKPLITWTIEKAKESKYIDNIIVSTDCEQMKSIAETEGIYIPFLRPDYLATDVSTTVDVVEHALNYMKKFQNIVPDIIVLLEPTSPLRKRGDIDKSIELILEKKETQAVISIGEMKNHPVLSKRIAKSELEPYFKSKNYEVRRQELERAYFPFGVSYVVKNEYFSKDKTFYPKIQNYLIIEDWQCYEIDDMWDWTCVEAIMAKKGIGE